MALSPAERNKLIGILGMLGSDFPGERANAGSLATKLVREHGLTWNDVVGAAPAAERRPPPQERQAGGKPDARHDLRFCSRYFDHLTAWEQNFVRSVSSRAKLTGPQGTILKQAADRLRERGFA